MNCPDILELQSLVDRQLTPDREKALDAHIAACASCREQIEALGAVSEALRARDIPEAPSGGLQERLLTAVATAAPVRRLPCRKVLPQLTAYLDGELSAAGAAAVEVHTFACEKCFAALSELRAVTETLAARQHALPSEQLLVRIMAALRRGSAARAQERTWLGRIAWQPVAAGLAAAVVLVAVILPRLTPAPVWQPPSPSGPVVAMLPSPETSTPEVAPPTSTATAPMAEQPGALARLRNALSGHRSETTAIMTSTGPRDIAPRAWIAPPTPEHPLRTPAGGPVLASAGSSLPTVAPAAIAPDSRPATLATATSGLAQGDEQPHTRAISRDVPTEKPRPSDIALAPRPEPAPMASEPDLVPRRALQPAGEIYRSEGIDRERLALAAERLNERGARVRMANAKNIVIIH